MLGVAAKESSMTDRCELSPFMTTIIATEFAVRTTLKSLRIWLGGIGVPEAGCGMIELATAEALNNICEHAYSGMEPGPIDITAMKRGTRLVVILRDSGHPQPDGTLPQGSLPDVAGPYDSLPEGGFGWFLIRQLTQSLRYSRIGGDNRLELAFSLNRS